jgi:hypothetical protein
MRRFPNPWVAVPVLVAGIAGGVVGYLVTDASCAPGSCALAAGITAVLAGAIIAAGVGVVAVLALRSFDEHRTHRERSVVVFDPEDE